MSLSSRLLACCAPLAVLATAPAYAADYDPPIIMDDAPEYVPVEIGSGWYLRGDVSYNVNKPYRHEAIGPLPWVRLNQRTVPMGASVGFGYHINDFLRAEANVGLLSINEARLQTRIAGFAGVDDRARNALWSGMLNIYGDLGTIAGFTPYVGGGVGMVLAKHDYRSRINFDDPALVDLDIRDRSRDYRFAYSLGAGVAYNVSPNLALDVGYQYLASPGAEYVEIRNPGAYRVRKGIDFHQIKVGLRYALW